ncbi:MAG: tetratricopeptide repeat protein [Acetobacteraceae bacterium]
MVDAVASCRAFLAQRPDAASIWVDLSRALLDDDRSEEALEALDVGLAIDPSLVHGWLTRGALCKALHRFDDAVDAFEQADRLVPGKAAVLAALGTAHAELGQLGAAEDCLRRAIARDPNRTEAHASLGSVHVRQGRFDLAEAACRRALELSPDLAVAHRNLAGMLARTRPAEARAHRDWGYRRQQVFIAAATRPRRTVLVLCGADATNVPLAYLLPRETCTLIKWFIEYAPPGQASTLPAYDFVFNGIGDADFAAAAAVPMARFLADCRRPFLNHPARIARTGRGDQGNLYAALAAVAVPRVLRLAPGEDVARAMRSAGLEPPVIVRPIGSHGGEDARLITSWADLEEGAGLHQGAYVTEFVDSRGADGLFRKYRAIFVDRAPYPYHLAVSHQWLVHYWTADMPATAAYREEEQRFLEDPEAAIGIPAMRALTAIGARLDLDYAGIDFAILPDGRLLVFEANATMLVHAEESEMFAYKNPAARRIRDAFEAMLDRLPG